MHMAFSYCVLHINFYEFVTEKMILQELAWNSVWKMMKERQNPLLFGTKITGTFSNKKILILFCLWVDDVEITQNKKC